MRSNSIGAPPEFAAAFDALDAAVAAIAALDFGTVTPPVRFRALERLEAARRRQVALSHRLIAGLADEDPADIGGPVHKTVADWLRISCARARRRVRDAVQLAPRLSLTGQELPAELPATAQFWHDGVLDEEHLRVIQRFLRDLPGATPRDTVERAERFLAEKSAQLRPNQLEKLADRYAQLVNPDGKFSDIDRARKRGFVWCGQRSDGMSIGKLLRMATHAYHYLAVFDEHTNRPLYLGRSRRVASADQRVVLYARDRGCTFPGCDAPGYVCEVHHVDDWARRGLTNVDELTFACKPHHRLVETGWRTKKLNNGDTEWIPPPQLGLPGGTNDFQHPQRYLPEDPTHGEPRESA